ncbi:MAG TPA: protein translocase subunit SecD [Gammaproteobacteria bacterium]|nr:protein translocase subunit SecD [Gammaproteobacteria bacterium]
MNRYPLWKYLLVILVTLIGFVYALPNLYPADPALQITGSGTARVDDGVKTKVDKILSESSLPSKSAQLDDGKLTVRFADTDTQLTAFAKVKDALSSEYVTALNLAPSTPEWLSAIGGKPMYLGLDLRGGVHFLLEVDMKAALDKALERYQTDFRGTLREEKVRYLGVRKEQGLLAVKFREPEHREAGMAALSKNFRGEFELTEEDKDGALTIRAVLKQKTQDDIKRFALKQNITSLRKRVNELGVAEPIIQQQGLDRIVVQLPGVQDTARAKKILGATATLEFRLVDEQGDPFAAKSSGRVPPGDQLYHERDGTPVLLKRRVMLTGEYITDAQSGIDQRDGGPSVSITLDGKGARLFSKVTGANVKKLMAVVFIETKPDGRKVKNVINIARIQEQLSKRFQITGLDSTTEARDLALLLRAGALAAPMRFVEERTVGPSLGKANIEQGFKSVVFGFILVLVFMLIYYKVFGLIANIALALNLVLIVAALSMMQATLTMPGIAGIVLTVGMAVDANVLIFERIREELRAGNSPQASINAGYEKAFSTIADANITTLIAAVVLFTFGTGPIKGFAVTLSIGVLFSMFTAIMGTRAIINLIYGGKPRLKSLPI